MISVYDRHFLHHFTLCVSHFSVFFFFSFHVCICYFQFGLFPVLIQPPLSTVGNLTRFYRFIFPEIAFLVHVLQYLLIIIIIIIIYFFYYSDCFLFLLSFFFLSHFLESSISCLLLRIPFDLFYSSSSFSVVLLVCLIG
jgi:hypothetical protein